MLLLDTETVRDYSCILERYRNQIFPVNMTSLTYQKLVRTFHQSSMLALREGNLILNTNRNASTVRAIKQWSSETARNESLSLMSFKDTTGQVVARALDTVVAGQKSGWSPCFSFGDCGIKKQQVLCITLKHHVRLEGILLWLHIVSGQQTTDKHCYFFLVALVSSLICCPASICREGRKHRLVLYGRKTVSLAGLWTFLTFILSERTYH